ncbi:TPA: helix-turn-helix transcriptional regulator [Clostridioides difficile]|uniref:helix-turn-helix domain-containing protein n=1 Tax=Clostridioides difficile TaxID=1496 RepID=UPI00038D7084|nr:helix-turn-helix transcriptional regulator [Clostridioides difficile]EGT5508120.1 XRE family transcriptional regulator [Clostridioides difficile]EGT5540675.1 XRE family transcriptional regulator [Clostridioides difficile]EGT5549975.1 XRE family transcriptional regulator [Clostridioides difficile]EGT5553665.1 XRE family transcriptional regulator [Clostridioides difficile]EJA6640745.1 helix-turn-helix transcriptional regulator [Clostridioides difficile]
MIGYRIKELRKEKDITQKELATFLGLTPKMISFYEKEERFPPHDIILKLSDFFDVSTDYLLGKVNVKNVDNLSELELIENLNFSDDIKEALKLISELSPSSQEKMFKIAKVFLEEEINEKK